MSFNENTFMLIGTAIAIFGVGLYIWDTRGDSVKSAASQGYTAIMQPRTGGSRKRRIRKKHRKTRKY